MSDTQEKLEEILDNLGERYIMVEHRLIHQGMPESNGKHKELEHAKTKISHLIDSAKREGAIEIRNLYGSPKCEALHHPKKYQHTALEDCPVEKEINALTEQSEESEE